MKCYTCGEEASVSVREAAMIRSRVATKYYCKECGDRDRWK